MVKPEDCKAEAAYPQPKGGQHVGTGSPAVRVTHLPTGTIAVFEGRSQHHSHKVCMEMIEWALAQ